MDYEYKEKLTQGRIKYDLKQTCMFQIKNFGLLILFIIFLMVVTILVCGIKDFDFWNNVPLFVLFVIFAGISLTALGYWCYCVWLWFNIDRMYSIVTDNYIGVVCKMKLDQFSRYMTFKMYGKYTLHERYDFYSWSENYSMGIPGLLQSSSSGDEFYLVIVRNKIRCLYNKKMFVIAEK